MISFLHPKERFVLPIAFMALGFSGLQAQTVTNWKATGGSGIWNNNPSGVVWSNGRPGTSSIAEFGYDTFPTSGTVTVNAGTGFTTASPHQLRVAAGNWTFNLGLTTTDFGGAFSTAGADGIPSALVFGDGGGNTPIVAINGGIAGTPAHLGFFNLVLGTNGSGGNQIGTGASSTVTFSNVDFVRSESNNSLGLTVGTVGGGGGNVFRATAGDPFAGKDFGGIVVNAAATGNAANRLEVDGVTHNVAGSLTLAGNATPQADVTGQVLVKNGGQLNLGTNAADIGSGTELRVQSGGKFTAKFTTVQAGGALVVQGTGSSIFASGGLGVNGTATISGGAIVTETGPSGVGTGGHLTIVGSTVSGSLASTEQPSPDQQHIDGQLDVQNGSQYTITKTGSNPNGANLSFNSGSVVNVSGGSTMSLEGTLFTKSGSNLTITGGSSVTAEQWSPHYLGDAGGAITAEEGSVFTVGQLLPYYASRNAPVNDLSVNGRVVWGNGGSAVNFEGSAGVGFELRVSAATTLQLAGGQYNLHANGKNDPGGSLVLNGGRLEGSGDFDDNSRIVLNGGVVNPGTAAEPGTINATFNLAAPTTFAFTLFGRNVGDYDTVGAYVGQEFSINTVKIELAGGYNPSKGDSFALFQDISGNFGGGTLRFTASNFDLPALRNGLGWDTSHLGTNGLLGVIAVPEPSALAMLAVGCAIFAARAAIRSRRQRQG